MEHDRKVLKVDARGRVNLTDIAKNSAHYMVSRHENGIIVMVPPEVLPKTFVATIEGQGKS